MFDEPFRGSAAVVEGRVTPRQLRGPRFRRPFRDVYVPAEVEVDLALRSRAAYLLVAGRGALGGWSAAELLDASCGPSDAPAEVITCSARRAQPGLRIRQERLPPDELTEVDRIVVTTPLRTAFDLACRPPLVEAVVAVDALSRVHNFDPARLREVHHRHLGARGCRQLTSVLDRADPRAGSPMETRIRLAIRDDGLPLPHLQYPVGPYLLDLAYPVIKLAIEYDGREHLTPERALRDLDRQAYLSATGWKVLRFRAAEVYQPIIVANGVRHAFVIYGRRHDRTFSEVVELITFAGQPVREPSVGRACDTLDAGPARCHASPPIE